MDYDEFLRDILNVDQAKSTKPPFLVLGADYGDVFVANRLDPHLLALRRLTNELVEGGYSKSIIQVFLTLRVDGRNASWDITGPARVRLMSKLKYVRCDVHFLSDEVTGSTPERLRHLLSVRILEGARVCLDRIHKAHIEFQDERFWDNLRESVRRLNTS